MHFRLDGIKIDGLAGDRGNRLRLQSVDDERAAVNALQFGDDAGLHVLPGSRNRQAVGGTDFRGRIEFPDDMAGIIDLRRRAKFAEGSGNAVLAVIHRHLRAEEADAEGITLEGDIAAFPADAAGLRRRNDVQHRLFQPVGGIKPPGSVKSDDHHNGDGEPEEFFGRAGLA
ncbi:hypothetical protein D3C71_1290930 [compost metagenome]